jgi:hypothetical protein
MLNSSSRTEVKAAKGLSAALGCHPEPMRCAQGKLREGPLTGEVFSPNV